LICWNTSHERSERVARAGNKLAEIELARIARFATARPEERLLFYPRWSVCGLVLDPAKVFGKGTRRVERFGRFVLNNEKSSAPPDLTGLGIGLDVVTAEDYGGVLPENP
jgi:hypothetical protein